MKYYKIYLFCLSIMSFFFACEEESSYDISYPKIVVSSVSSMTAELGSTIEIQGQFEEVSSVYFGEAKAEFEANAAGTTLSVTVPRTTDPEGVTIVISNNYSLSTAIAELFIPTVPSTSVSQVSEIQSELTFTVEGENVDLITSLRVNGKEASVLTAAPDKIIASVAGMGLNPGGLATVEFMTLALDVIPPVEKINIVYPFVVYSEVIIFDFEDGTHLYSGDDQASIKEGDVNGKVEKYFELRAPGYGWDKATGDMALAEAPDFSTMVNPYITFCVRTPLGSAGYFQLEDQTGMWRHFNYSFQTDGEWMIVSQPLEENWEGDGAFNPATFTPKLTFKAGNAKEHQDIDIAYFKLTEGPYDGSQNVGDKMGGSDKPAIIKLLDFENASDYADVTNDGNVIMSVNLRPEVEAFYGTGALGVVGDGTQGAWGSYWGSTFAFDPSEENISAFEDPYFSFAINSIDQKQYVIFKFYQFDGKLQMGAKFFPQTSGKWETFQFSLFNQKLENWSPEEEGNEYQSYLKGFETLQSDKPIDKVEIIVGSAADANNNATVIEFSMDEVAITEGPRF